MNFSIDLFHSFSTLQGIQKIEANLQIPLGEYVSISGISGSGKTTFLRLISGLIKPQNGTIYWGEQVWHDTKTKQCIPPQERNIGMVFQDYALFLSCGGIHCLFLVSCQTCSPQQIVPFWG